MRGLWAVALAWLLLSGSVARATDPPAAAAPIVEQLLAHAADLQLGAEQIGALRTISERRTQTLKVLQQRLDASDAQASAAAAQDSMTLMQEIGRLRVLSDAEALRQLTTMQRQRWVQVHGHAEPSNVSR